MIHFDFSDIKAMAKADPQRELRLHWEGCEMPAEKTTPRAIMADIEAGEYTGAQFDEIGYCVAELQWLLEQSESGEPVKVMLYSDDSISLGSLVTGYRAADRGDLVRHLNNGRPAPVDIGERVRLPGWPYALSSQADRERWEADVRAVFVATA